MELHTRIQMSSMHKYLSAHIPILSHNSSTGTDNSLANKKIWQSQYRDNTTN